MADLGQTRVELHCHSSASDGALRPAELIEYAHSEGIATLALTDHDTLAGHAECLAAGERAGVRVIPGIEVSALSARGEIHILGYGLRPATAALRERIERLRDARDGRARAILARLDGLGVHVEFERVRAIAGDAMMGRPHIARALVEAGRVASIQEAFELYLADGRPANVPMHVLDPAGAIQLIHACGGAAVLAHPGLHDVDHAALIADLARTGLDGVEVRYPKHTPEQTERFAGLARTHALLQTGGSDFHTPSGDVVLGEVRLPDDALAALDARMNDRAASARETASRR